MKLEVQNMKKVLEKSKNYLDEAKRLQIIAGEENWNARHILNTKKARKDHRNLSFE